MLSAAEFNRRKPVIHSFWKIPHDGRGYITHCLHIFPGTRIGSYQIEESIGAGGMGEVYRASDSRLGRSVAIKALPEDLARDPDALERFEREARLLASINHPNVASVYGLEEVDGERFLILELIPGDTLAERIAAGKLPVREAVRIAGEIATGMVVAHEAGVLHRDLKPANVKITPDGRVKILDFGLARSVSTDEVTTQMPTEKHLTRDGTVVGTPAYMSPEQMRGGVVDKSADVWAFGCLFFEMLAGRRPFRGETSLEIAAAVQTQEPEWSALPDGTPPAVRQILRRCLKKDPQERLRDFGALRLELSDSVETAAMHHSRSRRGRTALWIGAILAAAILGGAVVLFPRRRDIVPPAASQEPSALAQLTFDEGLEEFPSFSPDGSEIVYCGSAGPIRKLFVKKIGSTDKRQLTMGAADDLQPVWSADGKRVLFVRARESGKRLYPADVFGQYDGGDVWSIDMATGKERLLVRDAFNPALSPDGKQLAVDASWGDSRRIWITDALGRNAQQVTGDTSEAVTHVAPRWSPDGKRIVFQHIKRTQFDIASVDTATKNLTKVTDDLSIDINPVWSADGGWIYFSSHRSGGMNIWRIAADGKLSAPPQQLTTGAGQDVQLAVAPSSGRIAYAILRQNADLWSLPVSRGAASEPSPLIATTREDSRGEWSADGKWIAFNSDRGGEMNIWVARASGQQARQLTRGPGGDYQPNWSADGRWITFFSSRSGNADIWKVEVASGALSQLTKSKALDINPVFSPDGDEIAYQSDERGRLEVWVMKSDGTAARQLSDEGAVGHFMRWTRDGDVLFASPRENGRELMRAAPADGEPRLVMHLAKGAGGHISFSPDGREMIDVTGHRTLYRYGLSDGSEKLLFEFGDPEVRIDYPVWSPDGRSVLFDRFRPEGSDLWMLTEHPAGR